MADDTYVQAIQYTADISDIQHKLDELANKQNDTEGKTGAAASSSEDSCAAPSSSGA